MIDLAKIRAMYEAATPGPEYGVLILDALVLFSQHPMVMPEARDAAKIPANTYFAVNARTLLPELCDEIERLRKENARLEAATETIDELINENAELEIANDVLRGHIHELKHGLKGKPASEALEFLDE